MGCDIHLVVERRHEDRWIGVHACPYHKSRNGTEIYWWAVTDRNYELFSKLAGVRDYEGSSAATPRGMPDDASDLALMRVADWGSDGHSHSWCSMREALEFWGPYLFNPVTDKMIGANNLQPQTIGAGTAHTIEVSVADQVRWAAAEQFGIDLEDDEDLDNYRVIYFFDN